MQYEDILKFKTPNDQNANPDLNLTQHYILDKMKSADLINISQDQISEVQNVKKRLAKYKIQTNMQSLYKALVTPFGDEPAGELLNQTDVLFDNPFDIDKKKKKKKK